MPYTPCEAGAKNRIQADRELNGNAKAVQLGSHVGQGGRAGGVPNQNDGLDLAGPVSGRCVVGERRPGDEISDGDWDAFRL